MPQRRKKSTCSTAKDSTYSVTFLSLHFRAFFVFFFFSECHLIRDKQEHFVLDHATICTEWYRLWSSFGFSERQWSSRAAKVEEYTRVKLNLQLFLNIYILLNSILQKLLENKLITYKEQINKRKKLLQQSVDDYEDLILRTGLSSLIDV